MAIPPDPNAIEQIKQQFWNGLVTGAALVSFAWLLSANWGMTLMVVTSVTFYKILAAVVTFNVVAVLLQHRAKRRIMILAAQQGHYIQLHLRD